MKFVVSGFLVVLLAFCFAADIVNGEANSKTAAKSSPAQLATAGSRRERLRKARETSYKSVGDIEAQHAEEQKQGIVLKKLLRGDPTRKEIALTFDDGPHPAYTPKLLDILDRYGVKATFFVVGMMARRYPNLVKEEAAKGHVVGNHTYHHVDLTKLSEEEIADEIQRCDAVLKRILGKQPRYFRPPGGDYNAKIAQISQAMGHTMVLWTDDPGDYANPGEDVILERTLGRVRNGGIILMHDGIQQTIDVLPTIITYLRNKGYRFVTVDEMLESTVEGGALQKGEAAGGLRLNSWKRTARAHPLGDFAPRSR
ncbi:MAG: polysaccharide deacetylase family protein [Armatimonadota bacterium]